MIAFHMHGHIASSRVWVHGTVIHHSWSMCGELGNEITSKIETHGCIKKIININHGCLGIARWGRSPPPLRVKDPNLNLYAVRHDH